MQLLSSFLLLLNLFLDVGTEFLQALVLGGLDLLSGNWLLLVLDTNTDLVVLWFSNFESVHVLVNTAETFRSITTDFRFKSIQDDKLWILELERLADCSFDIIEFTIVLSSVENLNDLLC